MANSDGFDFTKWSACVDDLTSKLARQTSTEVRHLLSTSDPKPQRNYESLKLRRCQVLSAKRTDPKRKSTEEPISEVPIKRVKNDDGTAAPTLNHTDDSTEESISIRKRKHSPVRFP